MGTVTIIRPGEEPEDIAMELGMGLSYGALKEVVLPHLNGGNLERVRVLHNGAYTDMFVDEMGLQKGLPRNELATEIYRANWIAAHPGTDPESLAEVVGPAVLFSEAVWR